MIQLQTTGRHFELDEKVLAYVDKKLGKLDKYLPRNTRNGLFGTVVLEFDDSLTQDSQCICEVQIEVKGDRMYAKESTMNMYAAIDICEQKLKNQVLTYKSKHDPARNKRRKLFAKMVGRDPLTQPEEKTDE